MSFVSHVERFLENRRKDLVKGMTEAGVYWVSQERGFLNRDQPYTRKGKKYHGKAPSRPGEFPKKLSGQLQRSITFYVDKENLTLRLGSSLAGYPRFLNEGTRFMAPWLSMGYAQTAPRLAALITRRS